MISSSPARLASGLTLRCLFSLAGTNTGLCLPQFLYGFTTWHFIAYISTSLVCVQVITAIIVLQKDQRGECI